MEFKVTDQAFARLKEIKNTRESSDLCLKVAVLGGGCSGFQYSFDLISLDATPANCFRFTCGDEVVVIDRDSALFLEGSTLDYVEDLGSAQFELQNPNSKSSCGCGNSFAM